MTWDYRQNLRSVTNHLNLENGRFFISNFMWLNFQNLVARYNPGCKVVRRHGVVYVICKENPRFKARQGGKKKR